MKYIPTFESFSQLNELTVADGKKIQDLLQKLKDKIKNTNAYNSVVDFITMDKLDLHASYDSIVTHLQQMFPNLFGKGREYAAILAEWAEAGKAKELNEATKISDLAPYANTFKSADFKDSMILDVTSKDGYSVITISNDNLTGDQLSILISGGLKFIQPAGKGLKLLF